MTKSLKHASSLLAVILSVVAAVSLAQGRPIELQNPSFETGPADIGHNIEGWTQDLPFREPGQVGYLIAAHGFEVPADGKQYAMIVNGHSFSQIVPAQSYTGKPGDILTLTVALGPGGLNFTHNFGIAIDGKIVAENSDSTTVVPKYPNFADSTATYVVQPQDAEKTVSVVLQGPVSPKPTDLPSRFYDHVRLDVSDGPPTPQQATDATSDAFTPPPGNNPPKGYGVFFIGHSFHFLNYSMPDLLQEIALSAGYPDHHIVGQDVMFGSMMINHWNAPNPNAKNALKAGAADVLTMVALFLPDPGFENYAELAYQNNPNVRIFIQENWLTWDANNSHYWYTEPTEKRPDKVDHNAATVKKLTADTAPYLQQYDEMITDINKKLGKQVVFAVPMGQACIALREKIIAGQAPGLKSQEDIFADALGHPTAPLQTLTAYCFYSVIYKKSPEGLPVLSVIEKSNIPKDQQAALTLLLQQLAWNAVTHQPLSGVPNPG